MRFSCNKRSPFNPLRHCGSPVASLFDCSENLQAISITLLLAEVPGAGWGGVEEGRSARRRRQRESQRVNKGKMKTINLKCRAAAATRYRVDSPPFRGKITVGSTLILEKQEGAVAWLFLFSGRKRKIRKCRNGKRKRRKGKSCTIHSLKRVVGL